MLSCTRQRCCSSQQALLQRLTRIQRWRLGLARHFASSSDSSFRHSNSTTTVLVAVASLSMGFVLGQAYQSISETEQAPPKKLVVPSGFPRTCCADDDEKKQQHRIALLQKLRRIVGTENVIDGGILDTRTLPFLKGSRLGSGKALAIVTPHHLHDVVEVIQAAVDADCVIVPQGQNTGLTGGSVPREDEHDTRPIILLSLKYLNRIFPLDDGKRVVCLAGVGLASLQGFLQQYFPDRESHSILGSTFLNPTTAAGVALGSGGTQMRKGPAYTERALYVKVVTNKWEEKIVQVVNTLDIEGMEQDVLPGKRARKVMDSIAYKVDTWSRWIQQDYARDMRYSKQTNSPKKASDTDYAANLCHCDDSVSRFNADTRGPEPVRSEGKVVILATVHDTFPKPVRTKTFWLSFDSLETALAFRREVCLDNPADLPISMEYMDRDCFDAVDQAGRLLATIIKTVGTTSSIIRRIWNAKLWIEALPFRGAEYIVDQFAYKVNRFCPSILPAEIHQIGQTKDHHVAMTIGDFDNGSMERFLNRMQAFAAQQGRDKIIIHECRNQSQADSLSAFRFVIAPSFRTWCVAHGVQGISVDYALPKNGGAAPHIEEPEMQPIKRLRYSHFGCNVVHEDLAYAAHVDIDAAKYAVKKKIEQNYHGKLPAEHGHGTEYIAPPETRERWKRADPLNVMNPGVGGTSTLPRYGA